MNRPLNSRVASVEAEDTAKAAAAASLGDCG
jgi:hypothetical protein